MTQFLVSQRRELLGCHDIASSVMTRKLHCVLKLCRNTVFDVATQFLMSRHSLAFWGHDIVFGVATRLGHGREALCHDMELVSRQG